MTRKSETYIIMLQPKPKKENQKRKTEKNEKEETEKDGKNNLRESPNCNTMIL